MLPCDYCRGDPHYVGLMGIDIFDSSGHLVTLSNIDKQIWANPADINVLPEYGKCLSCEDSGNDNISCLYVAQIMTPVPSII